MKTSRKHKHATMIKMWLDDATLEVEWFRECSKEWVQVDDPKWSTDTIYRFKPKMITVGEHSFPEPMRDFPKLDTICWLVTLIGVNSVQWSDHSSKRSWLKLGLIHATKEAAEAHCEALIALTEVN